MSSDIFRPEDQIQRPNLEYSEELYQLFLEDPQKVEDSWRWFFQGMNAVKTSQFSQTEDIQTELKVFQLIRAYRDHGSLKAKLDPLEIDKDNGFPTLEDFQLSKKDLDKKFSVIKYLFNKDQTLKQVLDFLEKTYCHSLTLQVGGCHPNIRQWFFNEFEIKKFQLNKKEKQNAFSHLIAAENLERFLQFNFLGKKRFSLEGLDVLIPILEYLLEKGTNLEMKNLILGMTHRGRINVLINFMKKNPKLIFSEFEDNPNHLLFSELRFTGDVKYHLGFSSLRETSHGSCHLYLGYNPSHLESVNPVICGITRAVQRRNKDTAERKTAVPVLIHGDAAFCGQGSTSETLQLSQLKGYTVGGSIHIILNNQVGFTTTPKDSRSTLFASDLSKSIKAPVLIVNADDVPSCLHAIDIALRFRYKFGQDIFIELVGYRKYGHNEGDEPSFTQPSMYKKMKNLPSVVQKYKESLLQEGSLTKEEATKIHNQYNHFLEEALKNLRESKNTFKIKDFIGTQVFSPQASLEKTNTTKKHLTEVLESFSTEPDSIHIHPKVKKLIEKRKKSIEEDKLDWALCELASYGTLLKDGFSIRLTGQDIKRGTFSHRHAIYYDYETEEEFSPLKQLNKNQECCLYNSPLSEMAALAFEYGNSCLAPDFLTLWEAQFGDFANGAQIIIDQFIASGEMKWLQQTDITLLLPHGYEGQGPEHSSAYLERFLQLCAQDNMRVCNLSTPANLFHALRRQKMLLKNKKPLIIMTPKSLLRHPDVISSKKDLIEGQFEEVIWDKEIKDQRDIQTLILCSGKVFYDLKSHLAQQQSFQKRNQFAIFRIEQLYPFPDIQLNPILNGFQNLKKIVWLQEETKNRGAWTYIKAKLEFLLKAIGQNIEIQYIGRKEGAASAEGSERLHKKEQEKIMKNCLSAI